MSEKINVAFLFGAGAEFHPFNLPMGDDFLKEAIINPPAEIFDSLKNFFEGKYFTFDNNNQPYSYIKSAYSSQKANLYTYIIKNNISLKAEQDLYFLKSYPQQICSFFSEKEYMDMLKIHYTTEEQNEPMIIDLNDYSKKKISEDLIDIFKSEVLNLDSDKLSTSSKKNIEFIANVFDLNDPRSSFHKYLGVSGMLDKDFHTIIDPVKLGRRRFSRIFNYYWASYFSILNGVLKYLDNSTRENTDSYNQLSYLEQLKNIEKITEYIYGCDLPRKKPSYYSELDKLFKENQNLCLYGIITTNYFRFCEQALDHKTNDKEYGKRIAYINGQLKYFEFPETLEVIDLTTKTSSQRKEQSDPYKIINPNKLCFPFIFGQSYVKPIVHSSQITEIEVMQNILAKSDVLVVLGYNINEDDNHINSYLREFAKNKPLIKVTKKPNSNEINKEIYTKDQKEEVAKKLRFSNIYDMFDLRMCFVNYDDIQEAVSSIHKSISL